MEERAQRSPATFASGCFKSRALRQRPAADRPVTPVSCKTSNKSPPAEVSPSRPKPAGRGAAALSFASRRMAESAPRDPSRLRLAAQLDGERPVRVHRPRFATGGGLGPLPPRSCQGARRRASARSRGGATGRRADCTAGIARASSSSASAPKARKRNPSRSSPRRGRPTRAVLDGGESPRRLEAHEKGRIRRGPGPAPGGAAGRLGPRAGPPPRGAPARRCPSTPPRDQGLASSWSRISAASATRGAAPGGQRVSDRRQRRAA